MRILTVTSSYPKFPGDSTAPFIESITGALAARGHEITMVLPARSDLAPAPLPGVSFRPYRYAPVESLGIFGYAEALKADVALRGGAYLVAPLAVASGASTLLAESRRGSYDVLHAHWVVPNGAMALLASRRRRIPLVLSLHGSDVFLSETHRVFRAAARMSFRGAAAVTACSTDLARRSLALGASVEPTVIPYGVDTSTFRADGDGVVALRKELGLRETDVVALAVGRLVRKKGFEYLVEAARELARREKRVEVLIAGKGDLRAELEEKAPAPVRFLGDVSRSEIPRYYAMADVVVVPSVRDAAGNVDGLPNVLLEAMASGRAIVATEVAGIPDAARAGKEALLVPEKDPAALADAIERLSDSPGLRRSLGESARKRAESEFSWGMAGQRFETVLRSVTEARRP